MSSIPDGKAGFSATSGELSREIALSLLEGAPVGLLVLQDENIVYANETAARLLGYSYPEVLSIGREKVRSLIWEEDRPAVREAVERAERGELVPPVTHRLTRADGQACWVDGFPSRLVINERPAIRVLFFDVTGRQATEQSLQESEERYRQLVEASPSGIAVHAEGKVIYVNSEAVRLLGATSPDEVLGHSIMEFAHRDDHSTVRGRTAAAYAGRSPGPGVESRMVRLDGSEFWVEAASGPVLHNGAPASQVVFRDITDHREAEARNALLERQLLQAQKLEAVGRLAGGVAHDFNNLLSEISNNAALSLMDLPPGTSTHKAFSAIQDASRRGAALTRQLLAFSRKQLLQPTLVELDDLVLHMEDMLRRLLGEDVLLKTSLQTSGTYLLGDPGQIEQVLLNLCINARDAMPDGGVLTITTDSTLGDAQLQSQCPEPADGRYLLLTVADTGLGMDHETLARIYEPFFTTKPLDKGTGLGLSTTYGIIRQHGGSIAVESTPGEGTGFRIWLPISDGSPAAAGPSRADGVIFGSELLLYVEDEPAVREVTTELLERMGYRVLAAATPREALAVLAGQNPLPALLLTDVMLPEMNGRELSERVRRISPEIKVLFTSGYSRDILDVTGEETAINFIGKPSTPRDLSIKLREVLDGT